jgi:HK97 family phage prohead protease
MPADMVKKQYVVTREIGEEDRTVTAVISTGTVDREEEVLLPRGGSFDTYLKNPVVLWAHQYDEAPIARTLWIKSGNKKVTAKAQFAETPRAEEIYQLFKGGYLNAFSIGFLPTKSHEPKPDEIQKRPEWANARRIYDEWELLEFSAVPVPANPEALALAVKTKDVTISPEVRKALGVEDEQDDEELYIPARTEKDAKGQDEYVLPLDEGVVCKLEPALKPEETESYIRVPVRSCTITATITISAKQGIKALYCGGEKKVATYLFAKAKGWTMETAKKWVKEHDSKKAVQLPVQVKGKTEVAQKANVTIFRPEPDLDSLVDTAIKRSKGIMF